MSRSSTAALLVAAACTLAPAAAQATFISFDERPRNPPGSVEGDWRADPIYDEYASLGVSFQDAYLMYTGSDPVYAKSQYLLGGNGFGITFTDAVNLPTHVSLSFSAAWPDFISTVGAVDGTGRVVGYFDTGGLTWAGPDDGWVSTPYQPHSHASFFSEAGISRLFFYAEGGTRLQGKIDNLYFGNVPAVPEPATLGLWVAGLAGLAIAGYRRKPSG